MYSNVPYGTPDLPSVDLPIFGVMVPSRNGAWIGAYWSVNYSRGHAKPASLLVDEEIFLTSN